MNGDGNREVEHRGGFANGGAPGLRRARGRCQHLGLELQELPHEAEVGRDDAAPLFDKLEGLLKLHAVRAHQVGQTDGGGARDPGLTVNEDASAVIPYRICVK